MKVFISWSGSISKAVAQSLTDWLGNVIQAAKPWMSSESIEKGARWNSDLAQQLEESKVGVICVTPDNINAPWLNFEAGALSKTLAETFVCPYLFGIEPTDLTGPLVQFQIARANKEDTKRLILTINRALGDKLLPEKNLDEIFEVWWPKLENQLEQIPLDVTKKSDHQRPERDIIEEMLELVRKLDRDVNNLRGEVNTISGIDIIGSPSTTRRTFRLGDAEEIVRRFLEGEKRLSPSGTIEQQESSDEKPEAS